MWHKEFYSPTKSINHKGDAMDRIVTEIASCENQIHQFFVNQKMGGFIEVKPDDMHQYHIAHFVAIFSLTYPDIFPTCVFPPKKSKLLSNEGKFYVNSR